MTDSVIKFQPQVVGEGFRIDPVEMLSATNGADFETLAVVGLTHDGELYMACNKGMGVMAMLIISCQHKIALGLLP